MVINYNTRGKYKATKIEKKFDVLIGFPDITYQYQLPMCSVIKFEFNPPNLRYFSQGKPTVLKRYIVSQNYTLQNGTGKVFHMFTNSSLSNHAECFFDRRNSCIDRNRTDPITVYEKCQLPYCTCQGKQTTPQTNPLQTQDLPKVGIGDKPKTQDK